MDQKKWREKQVWKFAKHDGAPPERADEEIYKLADKQERRRERMARLLESELEKRPGLLEDLERVGETIEAGMTTYKIGPIQKKHNLNRGWYRWIMHYLKTGQSDPQKLDLYRVLERYGAVRIEYYFALTEDERRRSNQLAALLEFDLFGPYEPPEKGGAPGLSDEEKRYRRKKALEAQALKEGDPSITWKEVAREIRWRYGWMPRGIKKLTRSIQKYGIGQK